MRTGKADKGDVDSALLDALCETAASFPPGSASSVGCRVDRLKQMSVKRSIPVRRRTCGGDKCCVSWLFNPLRCWSFIIIIDHPLYLITISHWVISMNLYEFVTSDHHLPALTDVQIWIWVGTLDTEYTIACELPSDKVGLLIGKRGEDVQRIRDLAGWICVDMTTEVRGPTFGLLEKTKSVWGASERFHSCNKKLSNHDVAFGFSEVHFVAIESPQFGVALPRTINIKIPFIFLKGPSSTTKKVPC